MKAGGGRSETTRLIEIGGAIAILRLEHPTRLRPVLEALARGGVRSIEVTMTMGGALDAIRDLSATLGADLLVGAGSVLDGETARMAILAGARFVVGPTLSREVVRVCHRYDVAVMAGAFTPSEILTAREEGADLVKLFPARSLGPAYLGDLSGPLPGLRLVPTGGITCRDIPGFLRAGAVAVGLGGALVEDAAVAREDYVRITELARSVAAAVSAARGGAR